MRCPCCDEDVGKLTIDKRTGLPDLCESCLLHSGIYTTKVDTNDVDHVIEDEDLLGEY